MAADMHSRIADEYACLSQAVQCCSSTTPPIISRDCVCYICEAGKQAVIVMVGVARVQCNIPGQDCKLSTS